MSSRDTSLPSYKSRAFAIVAANVVFLLISTIFVFARVWSRALVPRTWQTDDHLIVLSWVFYLGYTVTCCLQTKYGAGKHLADVPFASYEPILKLLFSGLILYTLFQCAIKLSLAFLYLRIFSPQKRTRYAIFGVIAFIGISTISALLIIILQCHPVSLAWDKTIQGHCLSVNRTFIASALPSVTIDLNFMTIALLHVVKLDLLRPSKIGLHVLINLGWIVIAACIMRTIKLGALASDQVFDFTWYIMNYEIWTGVECCITVICVTTPAMIPLLRKMRSTWGAESLARSDHDPCMSQP